MAAMVIDPNGTSSDSDNETHRPVMDPQGSNSHPRAVSLTVSEMELDARLSSFLLPFRTRHAAAPQSRSLSIHDTLRHGGHRARRRQRTSTNTTPVQAEDIRDGDWGLVPPHEEPPTCRNGIIVEKPM